MTFIQSGSLEFGFSPSPMYRRAVQLAERLPGHEVRGAGRQRHDRVAVDLAAADPQALTDLAELTWLVVGWKSARFVHEGDRIAGAALYRLATVLECYRLCRRTEAGELYCWGWPGGLQRVPCRLLDQQLPWSLSGVYADPERAGLVVSGAAQAALLGICPAFDREGAARALESRAMGLDPPARPADPPAPPGWLAVVLEDLHEIDGLGERHGADRGSPAGPTGDATRDRDEARDRDGAGDDSTDLAETEQADLEGDTDGGDADETARGGDTGDRGGGGTHHDAN